mgnify:CR=1 FL=1
MCASFSMEYHLTFLGRNSMMKINEKLVEKRQKKENDDEENRKISESK